MGAAPRDAFGIAVIWVPALLGAVIAVVPLWPHISGLVRDARRDGRLTSDQAAVAGSLVAGARADFFSWVTRQVPADATFYLIDHPEVSLWATYQLTPRRAVASVRDAQWLVLYGVDPTAAGPARQFFGPELTYAPRLGIARRR